MNEKLQIVYDDIVRETENAMLVLFDYKQIWLPKSQIEYDETDGELFVAEWLIDEKELDGYLV